MVCPTYCFLHFVHVTTYTTPLELHVNGCLIWKHCPFAVLLQNDDGRKCWHVAHRGRLQRCGLVVFVKAGVVMLYCWISVSTLVCSIINSMSPWVDLCLLLTITSLRVLLFSVMNSGFSIYLFSLYAEKFLKTISFSCK